jgi:hypothetical protein
MKKNVSILFLFLWIQISGIRALNMPESTSFKELLNETLSKLDNNTSPDRFMTCVAELKRIVTMHPKEWITYYYISLYEIQQAFSNLSGNNDELLNDAMANIDLLKQNKEADKSEVSTIEGYYYFAIIAANPNKNGQIYYKNVLDAYQKALKYNPENPRAQLLLLMFKLNMAKYTGSNDGKDIYAKLTEIENLFKKENRSYLKPSWGENTLIALKKNIGGNRHYIQ